MVDERAEHGFLVAAVLDGGGDGEEANRTVRGHGRAESCCEAGGQSQDRSGNPAPSDRRQTNRQLVTVKGPLYSSLGEYSKEGTSCGG